MNTQNVKTAAAESTETWVKGQESIDLSPAQFADLYRWIRANGEFTGVAGVHGVMLSTRTLYASGEGFVWVIFSTDAEGGS